MNNVLKQSTGDIFTTQISGSNSHRPDVMENLQLSTAKTFRSGAVELLNGDVEVIFGSDFASVASEMSEIRAFFKKRTVQDYGSAEVQESLEVVLNARTADGELLEHSQEVSSADDSQPECQATIELVRRIYEAQSQNS